MHKVTDITICSPQALHRVAMDRDTVREWCAAVYPYCSTLSDKVKKIQHDWTNKRVGVIDTAGPNYQKLTRVRKIDKTRKREKAKCLLYCEPEAEHWKAVTLSKGSKGLFAPGATGSPAVVPTASVLVRARLPRGVCACELAARKGGWEAGKKGCLFLLPEMRDLPAGCLAAFLVDGII